MKKLIGIISLVTIVSTAHAFETPECKAFASAARSAKVDRESGISFEQYLRKRKQYDGAGRKIADNYTDTGYLVYRDSRFMELSPDRVYDQAMDYCERRQ